MSNNLLGCQHSTNEHQPLVDQGQEAQRKLPSDCYDTKQAATHAALHEIGVNVERKLFFHATYSPLLPSIKVNGLGGEGAKPNWPDSQTGVVYLATSADVAESYAEAAEDVPSEWLDSIVILAIELSSDDPKIKPDSNVCDGENETLEFHGVIPWGSLTIVSALATEPDRKLPQDSFVDGDVVIFNSTASDGKR